MSELFKNPNIIIVLINNRNLWNVFFFNLSLSSNNMNFVGNRHGPAGAWIKPAWGKTTINTLGRIFEILQQIQSFVNNSLLCRESVNSSFQPHYASAHSSPLTALIFQTKLFAAPSIFGPSLPRAASDLEPRGGWPPMKHFKHLWAAKEEFPVFCT